MAFSSQAGLQALIHRQGDPIMASYSARKTHPPIFRALARKADPYGAVAQLARKLAVQDPLPKGYLDQIDLKLEKDSPLWKVDPEDRWGSPEGYYE